MMIRAVSAVRAAPIAPSRSLAASQLARASQRLMSSSSAVANTSGGGNAVTVEKKTWGSALELKEVSKEEAQEKFLEVTDLKRTLMPPTGVAVEARNDMLNDRFNYVSTHLSNENAYIVAGKKGAVAPAAVGQTGMTLATVCVLMGAITTVVYIKTQWGVSSPKELGDKLREKGAARREAMEKSSSVGLVRRFSANAEQGVKENVELVRRPSQQLGQHLGESFKDVVKKKD